MLRRLLPILVALAAAAATFLGPATSAATAACSESGIFWRMATGGGDAYGSRNEISLTNHDLDECVVSGGYYGTGQTARVLLVYASGNYVEAGWREYQCGSVHCFQAFMYKKVNNVSGPVWTGTFSCLTPGSYHRWQVNKVSGTTEWDGWLDCQDGLGFRKLTRVSTPYAYGGAEGEGFRRDDPGTPSETTMGEVHRNLQWRGQADGTWSYSVDVFCRLDNTSGWNGVKVTASRFDIVRGSSNC